MKGCGTWATTPSLPPSLPPSQFSPHPHPSTLGSCGREEGVLSPQLLNKGYRALGGAGCRRFSCLRLQLKRLNSWWVQPRARGSFPLHLSHSQDGCSNPSLSSQDYRGPNCTCPLPTQRAETPPWGRQAEKTRGYCPHPVHGVVLRASGGRSSPQRKWFYLKQSVGAFRPKSALGNNGDFDHQKIRGGW